MSKNIASLLVVSALAATGCIASPTWTPIAYQPAPIEGEDPRAVAVAMIDANTRQGCVTEAGFAARIFSVKFVCTNAAGNAVVRLDSVERIDLVTWKEWYMVRVKHRGGADDFEWSSKVQGDMERLANALATLTMAPEPTPQPEPAAADAI